MSSALKKGGHESFRVLVIGATGNFGRRLVRLLAAEPGMSLVLGGRTRARLEGLAAEVGAGIAVLDRARIDGATFAGLRLGAVVDASGPFDPAALGVPRAAVAAGIHYVDLADNRAFVAAIPELDAAARAAGVAVLTGASSTPSLSHAAIDALCTGWLRIDTLRVAISPSNRQPRGRAVVASILAGVGQRLPLLREGGMAEGRGWGGTRRIGIPGLGRRWASLCDTPDLDLLQSRYRPRVAAEFFASLELSIMHLGLAALGRAVRLGWLRSALPLAGVLRRLSMLIEPLGSDWGGMVVEAKGVDADARPMLVRWWLRARGDAGPNVPVLPALAALRRLRDGSLGWTGAKAFVGTLKLSDIGDDLAKLGIESGMERAALPPPLFRTALGSAFDRLPAETRALHSPQPVLLLSGRAEVQGGTTAVTRALARLFGLPATTADVPLRMVIEACEDGSERWSRVYPDRVMRSVMTAADPTRSTVEERFGPLRFALALEPDGEGIGMRLAGWRILRLPMPRWLGPRIEARESARAGRHLFDVSVGLPLLGPLVRYRGWLDLANEPARCDGSDQSPRTSMTATAAQGGAGTTSWR